MTVWYLPLEPLDGRYTILMDKQLQRGFKAKELDYEVVSPDPLTSSIENGAFLDSNGTIHYKASQIAFVAEAFRTGRVKDGDIFFVSDLWFPGLESIKYMAYFANIKVSIYGMIHAGSYTETDYVANMKSWAKHSERAWLELCSGVFVGSHFHKQDLLKKNRCESSRVHVTGLPFSTADIWDLIGVEENFEDKEDIVVMAGRLCDEKQPWVFDAIARELEGKAKFIKTGEHNFPKKEYFELLKRSKVIFSAALQENFGYSVLEAVALGNRPVVPDRLAYQDFFSIEYRYNNYEEAKKMIVKGLDERTSLSHISKQFDGSVNRMLEIICMNEKR